MQREQIDVPVRPQPHRTVPHREQQTDKEIGHHSAYCAETKIRTKIQ
jgi:hypothetical protein